MDARSFYFSLEGRSSRRSYWLRFFLPIAVTFFLWGMFLVVDVSGVPSVLLYGLAFPLLAVLIWSGIAISIKRLHDFDAAGLWVLLAFLPYVGPIFTVVIGLVPGTRGPNSFGESSDVPRSNKSLERP